MKKYMYRRLVFVFLLSLFLTTPTLAETRYVSDQLETTFRRGPTLSHAILKMLKSGVAVDVLEVDKESGHSRVKISGGQEGWILTRYLTAEPPARTQLESLLKSMNQIENINVPVAEQLESENKKLTEKLSSLKATAANVLEIEAENKQFREKLTDTQEQLNTLINESSEMEARKNRDWFITGASVLFGGLLLGLILPKFARRKTSRYSDF